MPADRSARRAIAQVFQQHGLGPIRICGMLSDTASVNTGSLAVYSCVICYLEDNFVDPGR